MEAPWFHPSLLLLLPFCLMLIGTESPGGTHSKGFESGQSQAVGRSFSCTCARTISGIWSGDLFTANECLFGAICPSFWGETILPEVWTGVDACSEANHLVTDLQGDGNIPSLRDVKGFDGGLIQKPKSSLHSSFLLGASAPFVGYEFCRSWAGWLQGAG